MDPVTGKLVNDIVLSHGVVPIVDFDGRVVWFYPRGKLPMQVVNYLGRGDKRRGKLLRDHLVNIGRGLA
jgi:hypothetical protein